MSYRRVKPRFQAIRNLQYFQEIDRLVRDGYAGSVIVSKLQAQGHTIQMEPSRLAAEINAYRRDLSAVETLANLKPVTVVQAEQKLAALLNEAEEIAGLYGIQRARVMALHATESANPGVHNRNLGNEVRVAAELLRTSVAIKRDTGFGGAATTPAVVDAREPLSAEAQVVISDPQKRQRVLDALRQIRDAQVLPFRKPA